MGLKNLLKIQLVLLKIINFKMIDGHPESLILYKLRFEAHSNMAVLNGREKNTSADRYETLVSQLASMGVIVKELDPEVLHWGAPFRLHVYPVDWRKLSATEASQIEGSFRLAAANNSLLYAHEKRIRVEEEKKAANRTEEPATQLRLL
jgi:hypothetical protein